nr:hypothetical protein [Tanacetum cinerariifolium]
TTKQFWDQLDPCALQPYLILPKLDPPQTPCDIFMTNTGVVTPLLVDLFPWATACHTRMPNDIWTKNQ